MKYIDLFGGVGGFSLAIKRATNSNRFNTKELSKEDRGINEFDSGNGERGRPHSYDIRWQCVGYYEIDKYAVQTYNKNFGTRYKPTDITKLDTKDISDFDLLCAGFPCQAFSIAGKRRGFQDTRGTLFFEICRIAKDKRPSYLLLENVKGILSHDEGRTFRTIISSLDELGYDCQWQVLNSKFFGVPQNRERVFIIGHLRGTARPKVFPFGQGNSNIAEEYGEGDSESKTITATYHKGGKGEHIQMINRMPSGVEQIARIYDKEGISPTLQTPSGGHHIRKIVQARLGHTKSEYAPLVYESENTRTLEFNSSLAIITSAITTENAHSFGRSVTTNQVRDINKITGNIRRLTPRECERLQGFPDDWTAGVSDTQRYKQMGNAITVNVVEHIIRRWT